jgi:hypothetical protein
VVNVQYWNMFTGFSINKNLLLLQFTCQMMEEAITDLANIFAVAKTFPPLVLLNFHYRRKRGVSNTKMRRFLNKKLISYFIVSKLSTFSTRYYKIKIEFVK